MCEMATIAAGATVLGTGLSIVDRFSSNSSAGANKSAAINAVLTQTVPEINKSLVQVYNSNAARANQESDKAATESFDILKGMAEAKASAKAAAGDLGIGGVSFANVLSDFEMREGTAKGVIDYNYSTAARQIADENEAAERRAKGQINGAINQVTGMPGSNDLGMWAGIGADAIGAGIKIGDRFGLFDKKPTVDQKTGRPLNIDNTFDR